jgi:hypothetical protein
MRTKLSTWNGGSGFEYERNADGTIVVYYGEKCEYSLFLDTQIYDQLVRTFAGTRVRVNHCLAEDNIEDWLTKNGIRAGVSQYVAPIVLHEGYAVEGSRRGTIRFK